MKKTLIVVTLAAMFAACNTNPNMGDQTNRRLAYSDTASLYNHTPQTDRQQYIDANGLNDQSNSYTDKNTVVKYVYVTEPKPRVIYKTAPAKRTTTRATAKNTNYGYASAPAEVPVRKKGWSKAAKGAVIGGGSGAILGAVLSKNNKGKGAVIGGIIGAAGGYAIGRGADKRDGRY